MKPLQKTLLISALLVSGSGLVACAGNDDRPDRLMAVTEDRIEQAKHQDADEYAPLALNRAKEYYSEAQMLIEDNKDDEARMVLEKASVEAELAMVTSRAEKTSQAALEIQRDLQLLENQMVPQ